MQVNIPHSATKIEWLIIFLILDTNELDKNLEDFFQGIADIKLKKSTKIYLLKDTIHRIRNAEKYVEFKLEIIEFIYNDELGKTRPEAITITGIDVRDGFAWRDAIKQIYSSSKSKFSSLVMWSHGSGLGIANTLPPIAIKEREFNLIRNFEKFNFPHALTNNQSNDVEKFSNAWLYKRDITNPECLRIEQLFVSEISLALEDIVKVNKIDLVIMCNCNSHMIDNCYNLSHITNYYFAPMAGIQLTGFDFPNLINYLNGSSNLKWIRGIRKSINDKMLMIFSKSNGFSFYKNYFKLLFKELFDGYKRMASPDYLSEAIIVTDLRNMRKAGELFNSICSFLRMHRQKTFPLIKQIVIKRESGFPGPSLFDALTLFETLKNQLNNPDFAKLVNKFCEFVSKRIYVDKMIGDKLINAGMNLQCFTVWIPKDNRHRVPNAYVCQYLSDTFKSKFTALLEWDELTKEYMAWQVS